MSLNQFKVNNINVEKLKELINRVNTVEKCVTIEFIDGVARFQSAVETRGAVKFDSVDLYTLFDTNEEVPHLILPFLSSDNVSKALNMFTEGVENVAVFNYAEIDNKLLVDNIVISEKNNLKIKITCAQIEDIIYINNNTFLKLTNEENTETPIAEFDVNAERLVKTMNLFNLDKDISENVKIISKEVGGERKVYLVGNNYDFALSEMFEGDDFEVTVSKQYFKSIEKEYSKIMIIDNRIIIRSLDSNSRTVVGLIV